MANLIKKYHLYNNLARFYDDFYKTKRYQEEVEFVLSILKKRSPGYNPKSLLDVGCGTGSHLRYFAKHIKSLYGIDPSAPMIEIAKSKGINNCNFTVSAIQNFQTTTTFDVITSFNSALNYLPTYQDLYLAFQKIFSLLAKNGKVIVQLHDCVDKDVLVTRIVTQRRNRLLIVGGWIGKNSYGPQTIDFFYHLYSGGTWKVYHDTHQEYLFSKQQILKAMQETGFVNPFIIETKKEDPPFFSQEFLCVATKS